MPDLIARELDPRHDPIRLASIARLGLLDRTHDEVMDRASRLASRLLGAPTALVSIVTDDEQLFVGATGLGDDVPERFRLTRRTPHSHSFCQYVVRDGRPLRVDDAPRHPLVHDNLAIRDLGVQAYLGVPIRDPDGHVLGSLCVLESRPRTWTDDELETLHELAAFVRSELLLRDHLDQLEVAAQAREDLLRTVAHDLRASVGGLTGAAQTLAAGRVTDDDLRTLLEQVVTRQGERATSMLSVLLDRSTSHGLPHEPLALDDVVAAAVLAAELGVGGQPTGRVTTEALPLTVWSHAASVERIVVNLVRNALQHTDTEVAVHVGRDGDAATVLVRDAGAGLPAWLLQGDLGAASLSGRAAGHGIGLFSAVTLARSLGGQLTVETGPGGTAFRLLLPLATAQAAPVV